MSKYYCDECENTVEGIPWECEHELGTYHTIHCLLCGTELKYYNEIEEPEQEAGSDDKK